MLIKWGLRYYLALLVQDGHKLSSSGQKQPHNRYLK